jgi:hypothetical protein
MFEAFSLSMLGAFSPSLLPVNACKKHHWGGGGTTYPILIGDEIFLLDTFAHISANANFN